MKTIIVTGTPGTGKSTVARRLAKETGYRYLDVRRFIQTKNIAEGYDKRRKTHIIDVKKLSNALIKELKAREAKEAGFIIDSHLSHYLPRKNVDLCIVAKCGVGELNKRLKRRGYSKRKIEENLQSEIFDICLHDAEERGHKIKIVDTTRGFEFSDIKIKNAGRKG